MKDTDLPISAQERATITEQTTPEYRHDLNRLDPEERERVVETLRRSYALLRDNQRAFFARVQRPEAIHLKGGLNSSLYSLPVGRDIRLIVAVDDDPVFGQTLVTLFRAVRHSELERTYRSIANLLYRNQIEKNGRAR
jgi:mRNA-degrading endonuclease RelE of RelBE toxin-antitoxin system